MATASPRKLPTEHICDKGPFSGELLDAIVVSHVDVAGFVHGYGLGILELSVTTPFGPPLGDEGTVSVVSIPFTPASQPQANTPASIPRKQ
jgi:hypothetical protein